MENNKDWTGNKKSTFVTLGASNHSEKEREINDFYATDPKALELFLDKINEDGIKLHNIIWECACGKGHLSKTLEKRGYNVFSTDLVSRGFGIGGVDFLKYTKKEKIDFCDNNKFYYIEGREDLPISMDILTNPPYKYALDFVKHSLDILEDGYYAIFFLKIQFLEGKARKKFFENYPPKYVYVNSARQLCAMNGEFEKYNATALCYCWFIWQKGYKGEPIIRWI